MTDAFAFCSGYVQMKVVSGYHLCRSYLAGYGLQHHPGLPLGLLV